MPRRRARHRVEGACALRATFPWWEALTLSGVWRALRRLGVGLRAAAVQRYRPEPDDLAKEARLLACVREAAATPDEVAARFLDEMGSARWPDLGADWGLVAPAPRPVAGRAGRKQQLGRVLGALKALTGQVDDLDAYVVGREKVSACSRQSACSARASWLRRVGRPNTITQLARQGSSGRCPGRQSATSCA